MRAKLSLLAAALAVLAIPVLAQESLLPPGFAENQPATEPEPSNQQGSAAQSGARNGTESLVVESTQLEGEEDERPLPQLIELPAHARRDPFTVGRLDPTTIGIGADPWGGASGGFLSQLLRRMDTPIASRWAHIALRNVLLARSPAPRNINPVDWVAERAWLLLRLGEADAARMLVLGVDVDRFTPKMFQVAVQSALVSADPAGLCPLQEGIARHERQILPVVQSMCAGLAGEPESAAAQIDAVRRRGLITGIDLVLAEKVVGAGTDTGRAVTVEWDPVDRLNAWRFGLATATGIAVPDRLADRSPPRLRAWQARAPLLAPADRLESAAVAAGLGVFSSQALVDLHSLVYESTDPDDLSETDAWRLRQAYVGRDRDARLNAMRQLWRSAQGPLQRAASYALLARAATRVAPDLELQADAADLIASMLAAGLDREAFRWSAAIDDMDDEFADRAWAMLALSAPRVEGVDLSVGRINSFVSRDESPGRRRSALLVAGLTALNRLDSEAASRLNSRYNLRIGRRTRWTDTIDGAAARGQAGTVAILVATGLQANDPGVIPPSHMLRAVAALRRTGQDYLARMIAAEALART